MARQTMMNASYLIIIFAVILLMLNGCATYPISEQQRGEDNPVEKISSRKGQVGTIKVAKQGEKTIVAGSIKRKTASRILKGHVHVELRNKKNTILDRATVEYQLKKRGRQVARSAKFNAELDTPLTKDITVKVEHHDSDDAHDNTGTLNIM